MTVSSTVVTVSHFPFARPENLRAVCLVVTRTSCSNCNDSYHGFSRQLCICMCRLPAEPLNCCCACASMQHKLPMTNAFKYLYSALLPDHLLFLYSFPISTLGLLTSENSVWWHFSSQRLTQSLRWFHRSQRPLCGKRPKSLVQPRHLT